MNLKTNIRTIFYLGSGMIILFLSSCSNSSVSPVITSPNHHFMESFTPFSKGFVTSHSTGSCGDPFRMKGIIHGVMEAMSPFQMKTNIGHGGAGRKSPFSSGRTAAKKNGKNGDTFMQGKSKKHGDTNRENAFSTKIKKRGPPPEKHDVGLWPTEMRLK